MKHDYTITFTISSDKKLSEIPTKDLVKNALTEVSRLSDSNEREARSRIIGEECIVSKLKTGSSSGGYYPTSGDEVHLFSFVSKKGEERLRQRRERKERLAARAAKLPQSDPINEEMIVDSICPKTSSKKSLILEAIKKEWTPIQEIVRIMKEDFKRETKKPSIRRVLQLDCVESKLYDREDARHNENRKLYRLKSSSK